jgi:hypothetical protein
MDSFVEAQNSLKRMSYRGMVTLFKARQSHAVRFSYIPVVMKSPGLKPIEAQNARLARLWPLSTSPFPVNDRSAPTGDIRPGASQHFRTDCNCASRHVAARGGIGSTINGGEAIEAFPLSRSAVLDFFRVRCSANRPGDPIVAGKRANSYAINYPELQAWIEMAHRPLIEINDSARR